MKISAVDRFNRTLNYRLRYNITLCLLRIFLSFYMQDLSSTISIMMVSFSWSFIRLGTFLFASEISYALSPEKSLVSNLFISRFVHIVIFYVWLSVSVYIVLHFSRSGAIYLWWKSYKSSWICRGHIHVLVCQTSPRVYTILLRLDSRRKYFDYGNLVWWSLPSHCVICLSISWGGAHWHDCARSPWFYQIPRYS